MKFSKLRSFILDILFPKFCLGCQKEATYLCPDCLSTLEILEYQFCPVCKKRIPDGFTCKPCKAKTNLSGLYFATSYQNPLIKKAISRFKYPPLIKELSQPLASLIIAHFFLLNQNPLSFKNISQFILVPVSLDKKREKWRGFNQSEEIAKEITKYFKISLETDCLIKTRKTQPQIELKAKQRQKNIKGAFFCKNKEKIRKKKIFLIDDIYTTGSTLEECAKVLKESGAQEIWGVVVARE